MRASIKHFWNKLQDELNDTDAYTPEESLEAVDEIVNDLEFIRDSLQRDIENRDSER